MYRVMSVVLAGMVAILAWVSSSEAATLDLEAVQVRFEQVGGVWHAYGDLDVEAEGGTAAFSFNFELKQYRNNSLIGTITSGTVYSGGPVDTSTCSTMCNGTCFIGNIPGSCALRQPCICDKRLTNGGGCSPQTGDVFILTVSTSESETSTLNNSAQATF